MSTPSLTPRVEYSQLFRKMDGQRGFSHPGDNFTPIYVGDKVVHWGPKNVPDKFLSYL
jgi:hypothetical protein